MNDPNGRDRASMPAQASSPSSPSSPTRLTLGVVAVVAAAAAVLGTAALTRSDDGGRASAQSEETADEDRRTIRVTGHATVDVTPDVATVSLGAQHSAPTAKEALDTVSLKAAAITNLMKDAGIAAKDIQTSDLSVWPQYGRGETITGYQASNTVTVRTTDIEGLGSLLDDVAAQAGDQFRLDGISFSFDDPESVLADVRAEAIANARDKAGQFVADEDVEVGDIRMIAEQGSQAPIPYELEAADMATSRVPIEAGSQELAVDVTVIFELT